ncbi:hypothetical protein Tco_0535559 [Tanacetum coccineum]
MLLLLVQGKLTNLTVEERLDFNASLRMFTRSVVIQRRMEDLQLGVESYQKKLNLTKPDMYRSDLKRRKAYTAYYNPRVFIYQNKDKKNRLMRIDELHKFSNGALNDVWTAFDDRLKGIRMKYSNPMIQPELEGSTQGYPLDSVEVLRFYTSAGNPVKDILLKLNLPDHRILKDGGEEAARYRVNASPRIEVVREMVERCEFPIENLYFSKVDADLSSELLASRKHLYLKSARDSTFQLIGGVAYWLRPRLCSTSPLGKGTDCDGLIWLDLRLYIDLTIWNCNMIILDSGCDLTVSTRLATPSG